MMKPGEIAEVSIELYPTANLFKKGHRLRLDVPSSNSPRFDLNPNTGEPLNNHRRTAVAINTVYIGGKQASYVVLPIRRSSQVITGGYQDAPESLIRRP